MADWVTWFRYQLKASADGFEWAFSQISPALLDKLPPDPEYFGTWSPARHVWHVTAYERCLAIPAMVHWLYSSAPLELPWPDDDETWAQVQDRGFAALSAQFRQVRQQQIELLDQLAAVDWNVPAETLWGSKPLSWVVTKTFQHTYEHGNTLLRMKLWWEEIPKEEADKSAGLGS